MLPSAVFAFLGLGAWAGRGPLAHDHSLDLILIFGAWWPSYGVGFLVWSISRRFLAYFIDISHVIADPAAWGCGPGSGGGGVGRIGENRFSRSQKVNIIPLQL